MSTKVSGSTAYQILSGNSSELTETQAAILIEEYAKLGLTYREGSHEGRRCLYVRATASEFEDFDERRTACWREIFQRAGIDGLLNSRSNTYRPGVDAFRADGDWYNVVAFIDGQYGKEAIATPAPAVSTAPAEASEPGWNWNPAIGIGGWIVVLLGFAQVRAVEQGWTIGEELKVNGIIGGIVFLLARYVNPAIVPGLMIFGTVMNLQGLISGKWAWQTFASVWFVILFSTIFGVLAGRKSRSAG